MNNDKGFTLIEMVTIILLLGILAVTAVSKWPTGFDQDAARMEMTMAIRYAQHRAMTRQFSGLASAWGISIDPTTDEYSVLQRGQGCNDPAYCSRKLLGRSIMLATNISGNSIWFNGLGQPFDDNNTALAAGSLVFVGQGAECIGLSVSPETGYVQGGGVCP